LIEAKQELKKQAIAEKNKAIKKAEEDKDDKKNSSDKDEEKDSGNEDLGLYATLLLPFAETNPNVQPLIQQMLRSSDKQLKYSTMMLLLRNDNSIPDTLPDYFAGLDEYRYELYTDLKDLDKKDKFPAKYNNHLDLGRSKLMKEKTYDKPDSLVFIDRLPAEFKGKKGFIYFYKYKTKKDDLEWKLATVGLVPRDPATFEFENTDKPVINELYPPFRLGDLYKYDFTDFTETKIKEDEAIPDQLNKELKKILYSRRKSAKEFYEGKRSRYDLSARADVED
jgi:hypothetical protein